nr:MAG TPA: hypothetical protein [Caudoviricetes sp.]
MISDTRIHVKYPYTSLVPVIGTSEDVCRVHSYSTQINIRSLYGSTKIYCI